jgi:hypothetical protein
MSRALIYSVVRACVGLYGCLDAFVDDSSIEGECNPSEHYCELSNILDELMQQLTIELGTDALKLVSDVISIEFETAHALLCARTGLKS